MKKKKKTINKLKRKLHIGKVKGNLLVEMAEDFMDIITNAKAFKKVNKKK